MVLHTKMDDNRISGGNNQALCKIRVGKSGLGSRQKSVSTVEFPWVDDRTTIDCFEVPCIEEKNELNRLVACDIDIENMSLLSRAELCCSSY